MKKYSALLLIGVAVVSLSGCTSSQIGSLVGGNAKAIANGHSVKSVAKSAAKDAATNAINKKIGR